MGEITCKVCKTKVPIRKDGVIIHPKDNTVEAVGGLNALYAHIVKYHEIPPMSEGYEDWDDFVLIEVFPKFFNMKEFWEKMKKIYNN